MLQVILKENCFQPLHCNCIRCFYSITPMDDCVCLMECCYCMNTLSFVAGSVSRIFWCPLSSRLDIGFIEVKVKFTVFFNDF